MALKDANLPPASVDLLVPCGLGIASHDRAELNGLTTVFGGRLSRIPLFPLKSRTGNLAAGSGVDAAAAVLSLYHGRIPAALNTTDVQGGLQLNLANQTRDVKMKVAVSSVYSLGGQNAALIFKREV
jgi:3-oxoacyl-[acyl-carrier-protein] synthase-1